MQVQADTPTSSPDPLDDICSQVPEHIRLLFHTTVQENHLSQSLPQTPQSSKIISRSCIYIYHSTYSVIRSEGKTSLATVIYCMHDIETGDTSPIKQSPCRSPLSASQAEDDILDEMLESRVIEPSDSPWASPVCLVKKKDGTFRFCVDYRRVNSVSRRDAFPHT